MRIQAIAIVTVWAALTAAQKPKKDPPESALDQTLKQVAAAQGTERLAAQPGSLWTPTSLFSDLTSDLRARRVGDIVTILVQEKASAVSSGTVKTQRNSSLQASITAAGGITRATGPLANLAKASTANSLDGQGATTRDTTLTAPISAVVTQVLPNGSLVIQGTKIVKINNENQVLGTSRHGASRGLGHHQHRLFGPHCADGLASQRQGHSRRSDKAAIHLVPAADGHTAVGA